MTEQEYINVRDLSNVMTIDHAIRDITIENQPNIEKAEYLKVVRTIHKWREKIFEACQTEGSGGGNH